ncbi:hypothetical protein ACOSP7_016901 [Xanthoceras sorbifolium]
MAAVGCGQGLIYDLWHLWAAGEGSDLIYGAWGLRAMGEGLDMIYGACELRVRAPDLICAAYGRGLGSDMWRLLARARI